MCMPYTCTYIVLSTLSLISPSLRGGGGGGGGSDLSNKMATRCKSNLHFAADDIVCIHK